MRNENKTEGERLISTYECETMMADAEFWFSKQKYQQLTGKSNDKRDVLAYHLRQSFLPGEITPEEALRLGNELAKRFTKGEHAFIVCTHIDKAHIHNHIVFNAVSLDCTKKFRNFWGSAKAIRRLNDIICLENGYSIIEEPAKHGLSYNKWLGENKKPSHRDLIRAAIDNALQKAPASFDQLRQMLIDDGYEIKTGKVLAIRKIGHKRFARLDSLGDDYSCEALQQRLGYSARHSTSKSAHTAIGNERVNLLIDIPAKLREGKGKGYARWASVHNVKELAKSLNFLHENGIQYFDELQQQTQEIVARHTELAKRRKEINQRLSEITNLLTHILNYRKTRDVYIAYQKSGYSKKFYEEHKDDIDMHKRAKAAFDKLEGKKIPSLKDLQAEKKQLTEERKIINEEYQVVHRKMREMLVTEANIKRILFTNTEKDSPVPSQTKKSPTHED